MAIVEVTVRGIKELLVGLDRSISKPAQIDMVNEVGAIMLGRMRRRFLAETDPDGVSWVESNAAKRRKASGRGGGTLFDTGTLFHSIQFAKFSGGAAKIGTNVPYAAKHQQGLEGNPKRVFLGFSGEDVEFTSRYIARRIEEKFEGG